MKTKTDYKSILIEINILTIAIAIIAVAVYFFLVPSHTSISSMSGLGIVLSNFVPLPLSAITMILNVVLLIIGFFTCGKEFGLKTVYTSVMLPVFLGIFENIFPNTGSITDSQELDFLPVGRNSGLKQFTQVLCYRCFWGYLRTFFPISVL